MFTLVNEVVSKRGALLTLADVSIKSTVAAKRFGWLWWFVDPLMMMLVYYFVIGVVFQRGGENYHLFVLTGIIAWQFFAKTVGASSSVLAKNQALVKQIGVPLSVLVLIPVLVQFFFAHIGMVIVLAWSDAPLGMHSLSIVPLLALLALLAYGVSLLVAVLSVQARDMGKVVSYCLRAGFFLSPVLYDASRIMSAERVPDIAKQLFALNPMTWIIGAFRDALLSTQTYGWRGFVGVLLLALVLTQIGLIVLRRNTNKLVKMV